MQEDFLTFKNKYGEQKLMRIVIFLEFRNRNLKITFMKKLFLTFAVAAMAIGSLASCASKAEKEGADEGEALKAKIENCQDPDSLKMYLEEAQTYAQKLEAQGKGEEAEAYLNKLVPVVEQKDPSVSSYFEELKSKAKEEVTDAKEAADSVAEAAKDKGKEIADSAASKAGKAVEAVKDAGSSAVEAVKEKTTETVNKGKEAVSDAAQKGVDKVKNILK